MPLDFIDHVASGIAHLDSGDWLTPATVDSLTDIDLITLLPVPRAELFRCAAARKTLTTIWELLYPYRKPPESVTIRGVPWRAWEEVGV